MPSVEKSFPKHLFAIVLVAAILVFFAVLLTEPIKLIRVYPVYTIAIVLFVLGAWAAIGPGSFLLRVATCTFLGPLLIEAGASGLMLADRSFPFGGDPNQYRIYMIVFCFSIPICVATQVPFWFFRIAFGWQLVSKRGRQQEKKTSIKEILMITAVFAIAIASPRFASDLIVEVLVSEVKVGYTVYVPIDISSDVTDDSNQLNPQVVTADNIDELRELEREKYKMMGGNIPIGVLIYSIAVSLLTFFYVPTFWFCLRGDTSKGFLIGALFLFSITACTGTVSAILSFGLSILWNQGFAYILGFGLSAAIVGVLPLLVWHRLGNRLKTHKDFRNAELQRSTSSKSKVASSCGIGGGS
jgi:hypothetical protein